MSAALDYFNEGKVSQSVMARMNVCPHSALLYAEQRGNNVQSAAMSRGSAFHLFAEEAIKQMVRDGEPQMPPDVGRELVDHICDTNLDLVLPHHERDTLRSMAWNWCLGTTVDLSNPPSLEEEVSFTVGKWTIVGRIDWLVTVGEYDIYIKDYKTSLAMQSQEDFERSFQTYLYALAKSEQNPKLDRFHVAEEYPRFVSQRCPACDTYNHAGVEECKECKSAGPFDPPQIARRKITLGKRELHDFKRTLERLLAQLEENLEIPLTVYVGAGECYGTTNHWPASPGSHCGTCASPADCPLPRSQRPVEVRTEDDAVSLAEHTHRLDADLKTAKKSLRLWVDENGPLRYGDQEWDFNFVLNSDGKQSTRFQRKKVAK